MTTKRITVELFNNLVQDLRTAAETLRRYEQLHRDKNTEESLIKAEVNAKLASQFESTLTKV